MEKIKIRHKTADNGGWDRSGMHGRIEVRIIWLGSGSDGVESSWVDLKSCLGGNMKRPG